MTSCEVSPKQQIAHQDSVDLGMYPPYYVHIDRILSHVAFVSSPPAPSYPLCFVSLVSLLRLFTTSFITQFTAFPLFVTSSIQREMASSSLQYPEELFLTCGILEGTSSSSTSRSFFRNLAKCVVCGDASSMPAASTETIQVKHGCFSCYILPLPLLRPLFALFLFRSVVCISRPVPVPQPAAACICMCYPHLFRVCMPLSFCVLVSLSDSGGPSCRIEPYRDWQT